MKLIYKDEYVKLIQGDCLEVMDKMIQKNIKIDMILCDLPYGTTQNKWDSIIPLDKLWERYKKIIKNNGAIVLHSMELFSAQLMMSNPNWYKYKWHWKKGNKPTGFLNAKKQPLRIMEEILVFYNKQCTYNPQMIKGNPCHSRGKIVNTYDGQTDNYGTYKAVNSEGDLKYPQTLIDISRDNEKLHPTQKPVSLAEYLINTYTNEGEIVLDNTCGSGTTLVAAKNLKRKCIGIEMEEKYCEIARNRMQ